MNESLIPILSTRTDFDYGKDGFTFSSTGFIGSNSHYGFDNNPNTNMRTEIAPTKPYYFTVKFPRAYNISRYSLSFNSTAEYHQIKNYEFQALLDGVWVTIHNNTRTQIIEDVVYTFKSVQTTAIRLKCNSTFGDNSFGFSDLKVFDANNIVLIEKDNQIYTINNSYDTEMKMYNPISEVDFVKGFFIDELNREVTIGEETFKPIDKFDNFKIITETASRLNALATKSNRELIVSSGDIQPSKVGSINYINLDASIIGVSDIRVAFSKDKGVNWFTSNGVDFIDLDCIIPLKDYQNMSDGEKVQYEIAKDVIAENGMTVDVFNSIDFNTVNAHTIRFAFVLLREGYNDTPKINDLSWQFKSKGYMKELKDNEYDLDVYEHRIQLKSAINSDIIQLSVIT